MRNRLVSTSGKRVEDLVLLDENLLKCELPLHLIQGVLWGRNYIISHNATVPCMENTQIAEIRSLIHHFIRVPIVFLYNYHKF